MESPAHTSLAHLLRLDKAPVLRRWCPVEWPVTNHEIRLPLAVWSHKDGAQTAALDALAKQRADPFGLTDPRSHRGDGRYPEDHLWQAVDGYLDLLDASAPIHSQM